jgi:flavin reductase (DIM6/NTAB) family NADH-FMN oxidoreductase RutF
MQPNFQSISPNALSDNPFTLIGKDWLLITAGDLKSHNTMTASWGGVGVLWNKPVATVYIRPQRYTKEFVDSSDYFTLSVLPNEMRDALTFCGRNSGRDCDKDAACNLTPFLTDAGNAQSVAYEQARVILVCKKLYVGAIQPDGFLDPALAETNYPNKDFHKVYIGEIIDVLVKE